MARSRSLRVVPTIAALVVVGVGLAVALGATMRPGRVVGTKPMALSGLGRRVLVVATHPDDEVLTAGGALSELIASGAQVRVVIVTAGDGYASAAREFTSGRLGPEAFIRLGNARLQESRAAADALELPADDVVRLGYSDAGGAPMWDWDWDAAHPFTGRDGAAVVPYSWAYRPGAVECGRDLADDLAAQIKDFRPDTVISPDTRETNTDHAAVAAFTMLALDETGFTGTRLTAIVHFRDFPRPVAYLPDSSLSPPPQLLGGGAVWRALPLDEHAEQAKYTALSAYKSQLDVGVRALYMRALVRNDELFCLRPASRPATSASDARPTSGGTGTIATTPSPVIVPARPNPVRVLSLRMVRGPDTLWLGVVTAGPVHDGADYRVGLRLVGGTRGTQRVDVLVHAGRATATAVATDGIEPQGLSTSAAGDTLWISMPASVLVGRTDAIVGSSSALRGYTSARTPWVDVRL
jgi:LmbE family N-acetylglucosaminyl deacetylase